MPRKNSPRIRPETISRVELSLLNLLIEAHPERAAKLLERIRLKKRARKQKDVVNFPDTV